MATPRPERGVVAERGRRRVALSVVVLTAVLASVALVWFALPQPPAHVEAAFSDDTDLHSWPPQAPTSVEAELERTRAARRTGARIGEIDAGLPELREIPGLKVRTGMIADLYYIEAVFGDADFDDPMPMAVHIHGRGDQARIPGGPFWGLGAPLRVIVPQAPDPLGDGFEWLPVRVGQNLVDRLTTSLLTRAGHLAVMIRLLREEKPTVGRALVTGFSQGGILTFALATHHSDVVQAAFPLSAWLPPAMVPPYRREDVGYPRIRGMHGSADRIIAPAPTEEVYTTLRDRGFDAELVIFDGVEHEMTQEMNTRLHEWLQEELGVVVERAIADGLLDGGAPPCLPLPEWGDGGWGWPETGSEAGRPEAGWSEAGVPEAGVPEAVMPEGGWLEAGMPDAGLRLPSFPIPDGGLPEGGPSAAWPEAGWPEPGVFPCLPSPAPEPPDGGEPG